MAIVWDAKQGTPVRTFFADQIGAGLREVVLSRDGMYLVTLDVPAAAGGPQVVAVWDWTAEDREEPLAKATVPADADLRCVRCHPENPRQLVANGPQRMLFLNWEFGDDVLAVTAMPPPASHQQGLTFTQSFFFPVRISRTVAGSRIPCPPHARPSPILPRASVAQPMPVRRPSCLTILVVAGPVMRLRSPTAPSPPTWRLRR